MFYKFNTNMTDEDYLKFNLFHIKKSIYGKKLWIALRLTPLFLFIILAFTTYLESGFTSEYFAHIFLLFIICGVFELLTPALLTAIYKGHIKGLKKKGKPGFSQTAVMEFWEDKFSEKSEDRYAEHAYKDIERVYVFDGRYVYIYVNSQMAYVVPFDSFESESQRADFFYFLNAKGAMVEVLN